MYNSFIFNRRLLYKIIYNIMKTNKILASLLAIMLLALTSATTFADRDGDDDRGDRNEHRYEREEKDHDDKYERNEREEKDHDDKYERNERDEDRDQKFTQKKKENTQLKARYKTAIKKKLGNRLDNIDKTKLETIVIIIDTKLLELEADTTKTDVQKEKLVAVYGALRDLISEKIAETATDGIIDGLLN